MKVIDNILPQSLADDFELLVTNNNFSWYLARDIESDKLIQNNDKIFIDNNSINTIQFFHGIFNIENENNPINSNIFNYVKNISDYCCKKFFIDSFYTRLKLNLLTNNTKIKQGKYNIPHIDNNVSNSLIMIYYVNDSDGDTIIFNEKKNDKILNKPKKLTIKNTISPKKNRAVLFSNNFYHTSTNPVINEKRIVLNINLNHNNND